MNPVEYYEPRDQLSPVVPETGEKKWVFSFRFWRQIEFFGLDKSESKWFVSLLEKLTDLSKIEINKFISDKQTKNSYRYHHINWNQKNIPIQRKELKWIESDYLENEEEFPLVQFQISRALGRIVGFWDENSVFNIVLLDPLHNIQPSKDFNYKVDPCNPLSCQYTSLLLDITAMRSKTCENKNCPYQSALDSIPTNSNYKNVLMHYIDDDDMESINFFSENKNLSVTEILQCGIMCMEDENA